MTSLRMIHRRLQNVLRGRPPSGMVSLSPKGAPVGNVLLSYILAPFRKAAYDGSLDSHSNNWECHCMAQSFLRRGYRVDAIAWDDDTFRPGKSYRYCIDIHGNLERFAPLLDPECMKILHITGAHWLFQNKAEYARLLALQERRGITLVPRRIVPPSRGIEFADCATILGNGFTCETFRFANKRLHRIPVSSPVLYPWFEGKDFDACRNRFLWFGGSGMVHKGLDLVLEAFAAMPECRLTVCGPVESERDFVDAFSGELYRTPNIRLAGWVDIRSEEFLNMTRQCIGLIYPSCSEGSSGGVVTCMHAGLIPVISRESGVDVGDFGFLLKECSVEEIRNAVRNLSGFSVQELEHRSRSSWTFARENHTREKFSQAYENFVEHISDAG